MTSKWEQRLATNNSDLDEIDRLIRNYTFKSLGSSEEDLKKSATHMELSNLANNVTKAATFHALKGKKHLWTIAKDYSKRSKSHKQMAQKLEYGTQESLF
jgi:hypothetical protein